MKVGDPMSNMIGDDFGCHRVPSFRIQLNSLIELAKKSTTLSPVLVNGFVKGIGNGIVNSRWNGQSSFRQDWHGRMCRYQIITGHILDRVRYPLNGHQTIGKFAIVVFGDMGMVFIERIRHDWVGRSDMWLTGSINCQGHNVRCRIVQVYTIDNDSDIGWSVLFRIVMMMQVIAIGVVMLVFVVGFG